MGVSSLSQNDEKESEDSSRQDEHSRSESRDHADRHESGGESCDRDDSDHESRVRSTDDAHDRRDHDDTVDLHGSAGGQAQIHGRQSVVFDPDPGFNAQSMPDTASASQFDVVIRGTDQGK